MNDRVGRRVVDLVVDRRAADGNIAFGDFKSRAAGPVGVTGPLNSHGNFIRADIPERRHVAGGLTAVGIGNHIAVLRAGEEEPVLRAVVDDGAAGKRVVAGSGGNLAVHRFADRGEVVRRVFARNGVGHRNRPRADLGGGECAGGRHGHIVAADQVGKRAGDNRRGGRAVVGLRGDRRAADRQLERIDRQTGAAGPVGVIGALNLGVNLIGPRVGELRHSDGVGLGVERVENDVARFEIAVVNGNRMSGAVVGDDGVFETDGERSGRDQRAERVGGRRDVVAVHVAVYGVGDFDIVAADRRIGERAVGSDGHFTAEDPVDRAERDRRGGGTVVDLIGDRRAGYGNRTRGDRRLRFGGRNVVVGRVVAVGDVFHVDGVLARVGAVERRTDRDRDGDGVAVNQADEPGEGHVGGGGAVVDLVGGGEAERQSAFADNAGRRIERDGVVSGTGPGNRVGEIEVLRAGGGVSEFAVHVDVDITLVFGIDKAGHHVGQDIRIGRAVVDLLGGGDGADRQFGGRDRHDGAAGPVAVIGALNLDINFVGSGIGEFRLIGCVILGVERVENDVARFGAADGNRVLIAVIHTGVSLQGHGEVGGRDQRADRIFRWRDVVAVHIAAYGVGDVDVVAADRRIGERAVGGDGHRRQIGGDNPADRPERNLGFGIPVVDLVGDRCAADRNLARGDFESRAAGPVGTAGTFDFHRNIVATRVDEIGKRFGGVGLSVVGVGDHIALLRAGQRELVRRAVVGHGAAGKRVVAGRRDDRRAGHTGGRSGIVPRLRAGKRVDHADIVRADIGAGERARRGHGHNVAGNDAADRPEEDVGGGRAVVDLVGGRNAADGELKRSDRRFVGRGRRGESVVGRVGAAEEVIDRHGVIGGVFRAERAAVIDGDVIAGDIAGNFAERDFGAGVPVVNLVGDGGAADGNQRLADLGFGGRRGRRQFVVRGVFAGKRVIDRRGAETGVLVAERAGVPDRHVFLLVDNPAGRSQVNQGRINRRRAVVGAAVDGRTFDDDLRLGNARGHGFAVGGKLVVPRRLAGQDVAEDDLFIGFGVLVGERAADGHVNVVPLDFPVERAERNRGFGRRVVDLVGDRRTGHRDRPLRDRRGELFARRVEFVIAGIRPFEGVFDRHGLAGAGIGVGERAAGADGNIVAGNGAGERSGGHVGVGRAVVDFAVNRRAADTDRELANRRGERLRIAFKLVIAGGRACQGIVRRHGFAGARVGIGEFARRGHRNVVGADHAVEGSAGNHGIGIAVVSLIGSLSADDGERLPGDRGFERLRFRNNVVILRRGGVKRVRDRHVLGVPRIGVGERADGRYGNGVAVGNAVNVAERDIGIGVAVVDLIGGRRADHGDDRLRD